MEGTVPAERLLVFVLFDGVKTLDVTGPAPLHLSPDFVEVIRGNPLPE